MPIPWSLKFQRVARPHEIDLEQVNLTIAEWMSNEGVSMKMVKNLKYNTYCTLNVKKTPLFPLPISFLNDFKFYFLYYPSRLVTNGKSLAMMVNV